MLDRAIAELGRWRSAGTVEIPPPAHVLRRLGLSPRHGTLYAKLRALEAAGSAHRQPDGSWVLSPIPGRAASPPPASRRPAGGQPGRDGGAMAAVAGLVSATAALVEALGSSCPPSAVDQLVSATAALVAAVARPGARSDAIAGDRVALRVLGTQGEEEEDPGPSKDKGPSASPFLLPFSATARDGATAPAWAGPRDWHDDQLDGMVDELVRLCAERGLRGITSRRGLVDALGCYSSAQIRHAVRTMAARLRAGEPITSPFGLLIAHAHRSSPRNAEFFRPPPAPKTAQAPEGPEDAAGPAGAGEPAAGPDEIARARQAIQAFIDRSRAGPGQDAAGAGEPGGGPRSGSGGPC